MSKESNMESMETVIKVKDNKSSGEMLVALSGTEHQICEALVGVFKACKESNMENVIAESLVRLLEMTADDEGGLEDESN